MPFCLEGVAFYLERRGILPGGIRRRALDVFDLAKNAMSDTIGPRDMNARSIPPEELKTVTRCFFKRGGDVRRTDKGHRTPWDRL